jgi:hypothetical protein
LKVLLDECTPRVVKTRLPGHDVATVQELGWAGVKNGRLLDLAEENSFECLVTTDQRLRFQQDLSRRKLGVIVLLSNQVSVVLKLVPAIEKALSGIVAGKVVEIPLPAE